ncbi:MAG: hypothetical protein JJU29_10160 [Verrucomicrobia bacterium]|nr:hypothetical protein [Verrucomicrobiota bacterium]MCH8510600.1 hypothetical protein [Kiritimatiellia bacterium]
MKSVASPPPFFLHREDFLGEALDLLGDPVPQGLRGEWVDQRNLSGELFFRLAPGRHVLPLPVDGEVTLRYRDRSMLAGQLSVLDATEEPRLTQTLQPSTEWRKLRLELPPDLPTLSLRLDIPERGVWDVATLTLRPLDREGLRGELMRRSELPVPANLLPAGCFPLGLPQGWTLERSHSPETVFVTRDEAVIGPSGCPTLPVTAEREGWLRSPPMLAWGEGGHTASLWLKGRGTLRLAVRSNKRELAQTELIADAEGRFVSLPFLPADAFTPYSLEISWKESIFVHLDSLRVAPPGASMEYGERGRAGISLVPQVPDGLFTEGEPLMLKCWISGTVSAGDALVWSLSDLYDHQIYGRMPVIGPDANPIPWTLDDCGVSALGSYRLEAWVEDADGKVCSGVTEWVLHRIPEAITPQGRENPESCFGTHLLPTARHLRMAKRLGINWARLHGPGAEICYWYNVEPERGAWMFRPELLARYREAGFSVLGKLTTAPRWASGQTERIHSYFDMFVAPRDLDGWKHYVRETVARYGADIPVYEVWNEPWLDKFFSHAVVRDSQGKAVYPRPADPVAAYATLCRLASEAVDGRMPLIGLNTTTNRNITGWMDGDEWTRKAEAGGALEAVQLLSYHDYSSAADPLRQFDLSRETFRFALGPLLEKGGLKQSVWNTEGSAQPEGLSSGFFRRLLPEEPENLQTIWDEAERQARSILAQRVEGVEKIFLYTMHNFHGLGEDNSFTVLLAPDGSPHPAAAAFAVLARMIDGRDVTACETLNDGRLITFSNNAGDSTQVFLSNGPPELPPRDPGFSGWRDLFGNAAAEVPHGFTFYRTASLGGTHDD